MKKSKTTSRPEADPLKNNYGQAAIEYVLMLVISVSLVLALSMQIFKPFGDFISNYMGKYVGCLLEYGELPTLGSSLPSGPDEDTECDKKFAPASLANGRPPSTKESGSSRGSNSSSSSSASSDSSGDSSSSSKGNSSGTHAGSASRGGSSNIFANRRPSSGIDGGADKANGKVIEIALDGKGSNSFFKGSSGNAYTPSSQKSIYVPLTGLSEEEKKKIKKKTEGGSRMIATADGLAASPKKIAVKKPQIKTVIPDDEPMTIGNFMRYLLIAAIVIALLVFIGGQALQMSKNFEK
ncbi:MAG: hypothetical protein ACXVCY_01185 [Pseudobdellovibrionaceae bacterium]